MYKGSFILNSIFLLEIILPLYLYPHTLIHTLIRACENQKLDPTCMLEGVDERENRDEEVALFQGPNVK